VSGVVSLIMKIDFRVTVGLSFPCATQSDLDSSTLPVGKHFFLSPCLDFSPCYIP